jgi:propionyl-CoA carboxylase alpha chain
MGEQAVALAKAVGYDSAGTVEFVAGQDRSFFFLEMNTRLQVEHPVTELVTGIDLVEQMIRIAAGEKLGLAQKDVKLSGWAIESRIYAEDPFRGFLPSSGRLIKYRAPAERSADGVTVRNDTGVSEGGEIPIHYDPMIAKLCTHAPDRAGAIAAMAAALDGFHIEGIRHNVPFLAAIMEHPRWQEGKLSTGFIAEEFPGGFHGIAVTPALSERIAIVAAALDHIENRRKRKVSGQMLGREVRFTPDRVVKLGSQWLPVTVDADSGRHIEVTLAGGARRIVTASWTPGEPVFSGTIDGETVTVQVRPLLNGYRLSHRGVEEAARVFTRREAELARRMPDKPRADSSKKLHCPMPGLVVSIAVAEGQEVKAGETLVIVEAMKMENVLRADRDVTVKSIHVKPGDSLSVDAVIMEFA